MNGDDDHERNVGTPQQEDGEPFRVHRLDHVPSYEEFLHNYLTPNVPCILPRALVEDWPAIKEWAAASASPSASSSSTALHPAFDLLASRYGHHVVPVVVVAQGADGNEQEEERKEMPLAEAVAEMRRARIEGSKEGVPRKLHYIKDWHLVRIARMDTSSTLPLPYTNPSLFADDWMNNDSHPSPSPTSSTTPHPSSLPDDFRFCYAGTAGTRTGLHRDVYTSYSWSTNVVGRKRWTLFAGGLSGLLRRADGRGERLSEGERVELERRKKTGGERVTVVQEEGETIFVPSDCYHEVENLTDAISLNHNWCNSVNLPRMYASMKEEMLEVRHALSDVEEMLRCNAASTSQLNDNGAAGSPWQEEFWRIVQSVSRSDAGWDWAQFWDMVKRWIERPGCVRGLQPDWETWIRPRLKDMCEDFRGLEEWEWLEGEVRDVVGWVEGRCA